MHYFYILTFEDGALLDLMSFNTAGEAFWAISVSFAVITVSNLLLKSSKLILEDLLTPSIALAIA